MLAEYFEMWPATPIPGDLLLSVQMHITSLGYLEEGPPRFTEFPESGDEESNRRLVGLDAAAFQDDDEEEPPAVGLSDSEVEQIRKKQARAERRRVRKDALAKASGGKDQSGSRPSSPPSPGAGAPSPGAGAPSHGAGPPSLGAGAPSSGALSLPSAHAPPPASFSPLSTPSGTPSCVPWSASVRTLFADGAGSFIDWQTTELLDRSTSVEPQSTTSVNDKKRSFDRAFITNPLARSHAQKELDLNFAGCTCSPSVKINRAWQSDLCDVKSVCVVEAIPLLSLIFWDKNFIPCPRHTCQLAKKLGLKTRHATNIIVKERLEAVWENKTIAGLNSLFTAYPDWWNGTAIIYAQPTTKRA